MFENSDENLAHDIYFFKKKVIGYDAATFAGAAVDYRHYILLYKRNIR